MVSYLTARPSRDVVAAAHQQISLDWWERGRHDFDLVASLTIVQKGLLPQTAYPDALHIATAACASDCYASGDYLLTWNSNHIANAEILPQIALICESFGLVLPYICTPEELLGETNDY